MSAQSDLLWFRQSLDRQEDDQLKDKIISFHKSVVQSCIDKHALQDALDLVPISKLIQDNLDILDGDYQDNLLPVLTQWFAYEFFSWFSPPVCEKCHGQLANNGHRIDPEGRRVEMYKCVDSSGCDYTYDFIRHKDPAILLRTRRGRCGEWADCFFLILRAMDYDARIVLDTTDHVWNEVWSEQKQRWIHVDPCEAVVDCPLMYELGWSKKLEYCIAFSKYEVLDVTRRYTKDMSAIRQNRYGPGFQTYQGQELCLSKNLDNLTQQAVKDAAESIRETVLKRRSIDMKQLEEFETKGRPDVDDGSMEGRKSGSIAWRVARGEYSPVVKTSRVIKVQPNPKGHSDGLFFLEYDCDKNLYKSSLGDLNVEGWQTLIYRSENIDHKYERDWKTSYLARYESCAHNIEGKIQWRFDLSSLDKWSKIEFKIITKRWPDSIVTAKLVDSDCSCSPVDLKLDEINVLTPGALDATKVTILDLIICLGGGQPGDNVAWQKPQLFRQVRGQSSECPFSYKVF